MENNYRENLQDLKTIYEILGVNIPNNLYPLVLAMKNSKNNQNSLALPKQEYLSVLEENIRASSKDFELLSDGLNTIELGPTIGKRIAVCCDKIFEIVNNGARNLKDLPNKLKELFSQINKKIPDTAETLKNKSMQTEQEIKKLESEIAKLTASTLIISSSYSNIFTNLQESIANADQINEEVFKSLEKRIVEKHSNIINENNTTHKNLDSFIPSEINNDSAKDVVLAWEFLKSDLLYNQDFNSVLSPVFGGRDNLEKFVNSLEILLQENLNVFSNMQVFNFNFENALQYIANHGNTISKEYVGFVISNFQIFSEMLSSDLLLTEDKEILVKFFDKYKNIINLKNFGFNIDKSIEQYNKDISKAKLENLTKTKKQEIKYSYCPNPIEEILKWIENLKSKQQNKSKQQEDYEFYQSSDYDDYKEREGQINQPLLQPTSLVLNKNRAVSTNVENKDVSTNINLKEEQVKTKKFLPKNKRNEYNYSIRIGENGPFIPARLYNLLSKMGIVYQVAELLKKFNKQEKIDKNPITL